MTEEQAPAQAQQIDGKKPDVNASWCWIKDTRGYESVTVTFVTVAFWITTIAYILSIFEKIGPFSLRPFDAGACTSYMGPILALYATRKYTDAKYHQELVVSSANSAGASSNSNVPG